MSAPAARKPAAKASPPPAADPATAANIAPDPAVGLTVSDPAQAPANTDPAIDPTEYLDFVRKIASRMARHLPSHVCLDDLIGAGTLGLLDAMRRYAPDRGTRFETFAEFRIKGAILDELRRYDMMARNARLTTKKIARQIQELTAKLGRPPEEHEIAGAMDMSVRDYRALVRRIGHVRVVSLDDLSSGGPDGQRRRFEIPGRAAGPEEQAARRQMVEHLYRVMDKLPPRQQMILEMYYQRGMTLKQIGLDVGVTESRVCQIVGEATKKLRILLRRELGRGQ